MPIFSSKVKKFIDRGILPLVTDLDANGGRKTSIGRLPLFTVLVIMCYWYAKTGSGPDSQILSFIGLSMAYNGYSKRNDKKTKNVDTEIDED